MYILAQSPGDPTLVDSISGLEALHEEFERFLGSQDEILEIPGDASFPLDENMKVLSGLRVIRRFPPASLSITPDNWVEIVAPQLEVRALAKKLLGLKDGEHVHWHCSSASLIIQAEQSLQNGTPV